MATGDDAPIGDDEADGLLSPLEAYRGLVLAVSGGPDSTALMHLAADWNRRRGLKTTLVAVTVDHGLRPASAEEAVAVATDAARLSISHSTLSWTGPAPATGLQAAARAARYRLLGDAARELATGIVGPVAIVTGHTADDQAETLLMRLVRGSGVDGLAAIPPRGVLPYSLGVQGAAPVIVLRPLLGVPRARALATLRARAIGYVDDPSNRDSRFERVRVREALAVLEGLGVTKEALARTARRMQTAKEALELAADTLEAGAVTSRLGVVHEIGRHALASAPAETGVRLLRRLLERAGGQIRPADLSPVEDAVARIRAADEPLATFTLGGCIVETALCSAGAGALVRVYREPDRGAGIAHVRLAPGGRQLWDGRFWVEVSIDYPANVDVGPLGHEWQPLLAAYPELSQLSLPAAAARGIPAFRESNGHLTVPLLADGLRELGHAAPVVVLPRVGDATQEIDVSCFRTVPAWPSGMHARRAPW